MSKQFVGGLIVGAIAGAYVMHNHLFKELTKIAMRKRTDDQKETSDSEDN